VTEPSDYLTAVEAAKRLGVSRVTIVKWLNRGYLQGPMQSQRSGWRIPVSEVDRLAHQRASGRF
jgi:excisionase family DNA binding protein